MCVTEEVHFLFEQSIRAAPPQSPIPEKDCLEIFPCGSCFLQLKPFCTIQLEFLCPQGVGSPLWYSQAYANSEHYIYLESLA